MAKVQKKRAITHRSHLEGNESRDIMMSARVNQAEAAIIDAALLPGENRSDLIVKATLTRALSRIKRKKL